MSKLKDLTGQIFGYLKVIKRLPNYVQPNNNRKRTRWLTVCLLCGNEYEADGSHLLHGDIISCGCLKNKKAAERMSATKGKIKNNSRSKNLKGQIINENILVVDVAPSKNRKRTWLCECLLCGTIFEARANHLLRGLIKSCGCIKSQAEKFIREYFQKNNINFDTQVCFEDLVNPETGHVIYYDFALKDKSNNIVALLEYQGKQHNPFLNSEFGKQQREITDSLKYDYCNVYNIPFYEIWYFENLEEELNKILINVLHVNPVPSEE